MSDFIEAINDFKHKKMLDKMMGKSGGIATLGEDGKIPSSQLPDDISSVTEYDSYDSFPEQGETGKLYADKSTGQIYWWNGTEYVEISVTAATDEDIQQIVEDITFTT